MAAEGMIASLPSVKQDNNFDGSNFLSKERRSESKTFFEQSLIWEVAEDQEFVEPEIIRSKTVGQHRKVTLPSTSTTTKTRRRKDQHLSTEQKKLPKQNMSRSGILNPASLESPYRDSGQLSRSELPSISFSQSKRQRSFTEPCLLSSLEEAGTVHGKLFRDNLSLMYRQSKEVRKLEYDNTASRKTLQEAHDLIGDLKAKIEKRNKLIRERVKKEGDTAHVVETLRRERDEKLVEYKLILKRMNEALAMKEKTLEDTEVERTQAESLYQKRLKENTELMRKIEAREKQIKHLKEKAEKAKKWKENVRF